MSSSEYFVKCPQCGYPMAREECIHAMFVSGIWCTNCGYYDLNPSDDEIREVGTHEPQIKSLDECQTPMGTITCPACGKQALIFDDVCRDDDAYRLTTFCPHCWWYKRWEETTFQPDVIRNTPWPQCIDPSDPSDDGL